jgi:hypothetical protein
MSPLTKKKNTGAPTILLPFSNFLLFCLRGIQLRLQEWRSNESISQAACESARMHVCVKSEKAFGAQCEIKVSGWSGAQSP